MTEDRLLRTTLILVAVAAALYAGQVLVGIFVQYSDIIGVFVLGWLLAFVLNPLCRWVTRPHLPRRPSPAKPLMPRTLAVLVVYAAISVVGLAAVLLAAPLLADQIQRFIASVPEIRASLTVTVNQLRDAIGLDPAVITPSSSNLPSQLTAMLTNLLGGVTGLLAGAAAAVTNTILIVVFALYLNLGGPPLGARVVRLVPPRQRPEARVFMHELDRAFGGFLRGQVLYALLSAAIALVALLGVGAPVAIAASIGTFLLSLIPLLGSFLGLIPPVVAGLTMSVQTGILLFLGLGAIQLFLTNAVMPKIFGASIRLEPIVVFIAIVVGIRLAGIWGAVFAIPIAALIVAMAQYRRRTARTRSAAAMRGLPPPRRTG